jgi:dephospho-CoA kinase
VNDDERRRKLQELTDWLAQNERKQISRYAFAVIFAFVVVPVLVILLSQLLGD